MPTGREIMERAAILLNDEDHVRWPLAELADWINDAVCAIVLAKPNASSESRVLTLQEGTLQQVPDDDTYPKALALIDIRRNLASAAEPRVGGRMIRRADRASLDAADPNWHDGTKTRFKREVRSFIYDDADRLEFSVYPGNDGNGFVEAVVSTLPAPLTATGDKTDIASWEGQTGLPEPLSVPILDYVIYRAQSKDDENGAGGRAAAAYQAFASAIGLKIQVDRAYSPNARPS